jgi:hypothetical protein
VKGSKVAEVMINALFVYVAETHSFDKQAIEHLGVFFFRRYLMNEKTPLANLVFSVKWKVVLPIRTDWFGPFKLCGMVSFPSFSPFLLPISRSFC